MFNAGSPFLGAVPPTVASAATTASSVFPAFFPIAAISTPQQHHNLLHHHHHHQQQLHREQSAMTAAAFYQQMFNFKLAAAAAAAAAATAVSPNGGENATATSQIYSAPGGVLQTIPGFTSLKQVQESEMISQLSQRTPTNDGIYSPNLFPNFPVSPLSAYGTDEPAKKGSKLSNGGSSLVNNGGPQLPIGNKCPLCDQSVNLEDLNDHFSLELKKMDKIFDCFRSKLTIYNEASASKLQKIMDPSSENRMKILSNIRHRKAERAKKRMPLYYQKFALSTNTECRTNQVAKNSEEILVQSSSCTGIVNNNCDIEQKSPISDVSDKFNNKVQSPIRCKSSDSPVHCRKCFKILIDLDESQTCRHVCVNCFEISRSKNSKSPCNQCLIMEKE